MYRTLKRTAALAHDRAGFIFCRSLSVNGRSDIVSSQSVHIKCAPEVAFHLQSPDHRAVIGESGSFCHYGPTIGIQVD